MKKILFALSVLCATLWSCDLLDVSDVGCGDGDRVKSSQVKSVLCAAPDGCWKADYQGHEFYFQFREDGTVILDSDFLEFTTSGSISCATQGKTVEMIITNCDVHLSYLGAGFADTKFIVSELPEEGGTQKVALHAVASGNTIELLPTTKAYIASKVEPKIEELIQSGLAESRVVCDANGNFIAYYAVTEENEAYSIKVLTIENKTGSDTKGHTQYYTSKLTREGNNFNLTTPVNEIKATNGETYAFKALEFGTSGLTINGMPGISIISNKGAVEDFDYTSGRKFSMNQKQGKGDACDEIWKETTEQWEGIPYDEMHIEGLDAWSYDRADRSVRPLILWRDYWANIVYPGSESGANILMNDKDKDWIHLKNISGSGIYQGMGIYRDTTPEEAEKIKNVAIPNLLATWFNEDGLFVARQRVGGTLYIYLLCPDTDATEQGGMWMRWVEN